MAFAKDGLQRALPEDVGCQSTDIIAFLDDAAKSQVELHSFMLYKSGSVISEAWYWPYAPDIPHTLHSATKSFLSVAVGLAVEEGYFSLSDLVVSFFPDRVFPDDNNGYLGRMTVEDLLTQTSGHGHGESGGEWRGIDTSWVDKFFSIAVEYEPGTKFTYSSATSFMLSAIISKTTGQAARDYLEPRLFRPLGIKMLTWDSSPEGISSGGNGISCLSSDLLKLGILHLNQGVWHGQQILPKAWVQAATSPQRGNMYGYHWRTGADGSYWASGYFGQYSVVYPEYNTVLVTTAAVGSGAKALDLLINRHFPAILKPSPVSPDMTRSAENQDQLMRRLATLRVLPELRRSVESPAQQRMMDAIYGERFLARANEDGIVAFALEFREMNTRSQRCALHVQDSRGFHTLHLGLGSYLGGMTTLSGAKLHHGYEPAQLLTTAGGQWTTDDVFEITVQYQETAFRDTITLTFLNGGTVARLDRRVNVNSFSVRRPAVWASIITFDDPEVELMKAAAAVASSYSTSENTVGELLENEVTRAILEEVIPHVVHNQRIEKARRYTFASVARYIEGLDDEMLARVDDRLAQIVA